MYPFPSKPPTKSNLFLPTELGFFFLESNFFWFFFCNFWMKMNRVVVLLLWFLCLLSVCWITSASVVLIGNNVTLSFNDIEANFGNLFFFKFIFSLFFLVLEKVWENSRKFGSLILLTKVELFFLLWAELN